MVGDVSLLLRIGIRTIQTLSEMPQKCCNKWLVKTVLISGKKANGIDNNPVEPYGRKSISEHTFGQDTIDIQD
jgi:DNA polymerase-4